MLCDILVVVLITLTIYERTGRYPEGKIRKAEGRYQQQASHRFLFEP